jgi:hypothetical protein
MFTKEQLAKWRSEGFIFDGRYDEVAVENPTDENEKLLNIGKEIKENKEFMASFTTSINEDSEDRYIRKVLHMIRNFKIQKRSLNVSMNTNIYKALNLDLNGYIIKRITLEVLPKSQRNINLSKVTDVPSVTNRFSNITYTGISIDNKISIFVTSSKDKTAILNYINSKTTDNFVPAFSKFSLPTIQNETKSRKSSPESIAQRGTPLCGIACIGYLIAKYQYLDYSKITEDLYYYAEAFYGKGLYLIKPRNWPFGQVYDIDPSGNRYPKSQAGKMAQCDYVLLTSIKSSENDNLSFDGKDEGEFIDGLGGLTTSGELVKLLKDMALMSDVVDYTNTTGGGLDEMKTFKAMDDAKIKGYECFMLIDMKMLTPYVDWDWTDKFLSEVSVPKPLGSLCWNFI